MAIAIHIAKNRPFPTNSKVNLIPNPNQSPNNHVNLPSQPLQRKRPSPSSGDGLSMCFDFNEVNQHRKTLGPSSLSHLHLPLHRTIALPRYSTSTRSCNESETMRGPDPPRLDRQHPEDRYSRPHALRIQALNPKT